MRLTSPLRLCLVLTLTPLLLALAACSSATVQHGLTTITQASATAIPIATMTASPTTTALAGPTTTLVSNESVVEVATTQHFVTPSSSRGGTKGDTSCANGDPLIGGDCGVTLTATCPHGEPVLSGGYTLVGQYAYVTSSYPSATGAWTITAHDEGQSGTSHPVTVTAYADCLQANVTATVHDVSSTPIVPADSNYYAESISCPHGSVLTGGGFRGASNDAFSMPSGNRWQAGLAVQLNASAKPMVFAVCATGHLTAAGTPSAAKKLIANTTGTVSVACAPGQILVGGGDKNDRGGPSFTQSDAAANTISQWQVQVDFALVWGGPGGPPTLTETVYAICVTLA
jgi:hypothetical protein